MVAAIAPEVVAAVHKDAAAALCLESGHRPAQILLQALEQHRAAAAIGDWVLVFHSDAQPERRTTRGHQTIVGAAAEGTPTGGSEQDALHQASARVLHAAAGRSSNSVGQVDTASKAALTVETAGTDSVLLPMPTVAAAATILEEQPLRPPYLAATGNPDDDQEQEQEQEQQQKKKRKNPKQRNFLRRGCGTWACHGLHAIPAEQRLTSQYRRRSSVVAVNSGSKLVQKQRQQQDIAAGQSAAHKAKDREIRLKTRPTGRSTSKTLRGGWIEVTPDNGSAPYFWHKADKKSQWKRPVVSSEAEASTLATKKQQLSKKAQRTQESATAVLGAESSAVKGERSADRQHVPEEVLSGQAAVTQRDDSAAGDNKTDAEGEQEDEAIEIVMDGNESGSALEFEIEEEQEEEQDNSSGAFSIQEDDSDLE